MHESQLAIGFVQTAFWQVEDLAQNRRGCPSALILDGDYFATVSGSEVAVQFSTGFPSRVTVPLTDCIGGLPQPTAKSTNMHRGRLGACITCFIRTLGRIQVDRFVQFRDRLKNIRTSAHFRVK